MSLAKEEVADIEEIALEMPYCSLPPDKKLSNYLAVYCWAKDYDQARRAGFERRAKLLQEQSDA